MVKIAPTTSQSGRPCGKWSSMTHWRNPSVSTAAESCTPMASAASLRVSSFGAGVMRSTIVDGNAALSAIHRARSLSILCAKSMTAPLSKRPFSGRLSQHKTANAGSFAFLRSLSARVINPKTPLGSSGFRRSAATAGCSGSHPVAMRSSPYAFSVTVKDTILVVLAAMAARAGSGLSALHIASARAPTTRQCRPSALLAISV